MNDKQAPATAITLYKKEYRPSAAIAWNPKYTLKTRQVNIKNQPRAENKLDITGLLREERLRGNKGGTKAVRG
jgi:hypothetical protein